MDKYLYSTGLDNSIYHNLKRIQIPYRIRACDLRVMSSIPIRYMFLGVILEGKWARHQREGDF